MDFCFAAIGFFAFGYAIAYGGDGAIFGTSGWFMAVVDSTTGSLPTSMFWLFQEVFAGTAATIVSGAMAERMKFVAYLFYWFLLTAFVYPVVAHWVRGGGWLANLNPRFCQVDGCPCSGRDLSFSRFGDFWGTNWPFLKRMAISRYVVDNVNNSVTTCKCHQFAVLGN